MARVLVVDDNEVLRSLLVLSLSEPDRKVDGFDSGYTALESFIRNTYDLVVTDYEMAGLNGIELTREVLRRSPDCPVIGISGQNCEREFLDAGARAFIYKPFSMDNLVRMVERELSG